MKTPLIIILFLLSFSLYSSTAMKLYKNKCSSCHGNNRLGISAPPLLPQSYKRLNQKKIIKIITEGRESTQMPAFKNELTVDEIIKVSEYILKAPKVIPTWTIKQIEKTRKVKNKKYKSKLTKNIDPLNLFTVVEIADHAISILDGDSFKVLKRLKTKPGVHGGAKYSPTGRYMYLSSRDGWVEKFDMHAMRSLGVVRVGINTRNIAVSADGKYIAAANYMPENVVILNAQTLKPIQVIQTKDKKGKSSRAAAIYTAAPRGSFILSLKDIPEVWEIHYSKPEYPVHEGLIHDYRIDSGEGDISTDKFPIRRIYLSEIIENFYFDKDYTHLIGTAHKGTKGQVVNLDVRQKIASLDIQGMPHLGAGIAWTTTKKQRVIAIPNLKLGSVSIIDAKSWKVIKKIKTQGPGFFLRSHENSKYAWGDVFFGPKKDVIHVIDKDTFKIVKTIIPEKGKTSGHIEFTRDGRYAIVSIWEEDGAIVIYDAKTLKEVKRIKMKKPSGKYNVYNKIKLSEGTSH